MFIDFLLSPEGASIFRRWVNFTALHPERGSSSPGKETTMSSKYVFGKTVAMKYEQALERVTQELAKEGFGVLTEIDVAATLKEEIDKDLAPYTILGG